MLLRCCCKNRIDRQVFSKKNLLFGKKGDKVINFFGLEVAFFSKPCDSTGFSTVCSTVEVSYAWKSRYIRDSLGCSTLLLRFDFDFDCFDSTGSMNLGKEKSPPFQMGIVFLSLEFLC